MIPIPPSDILPAFLLSRYMPSLSCDLPYAKGAHPENMFQEAVYRPDAGLWLHRDLLCVVAYAAVFAVRRHGWGLVLKDGLRPVEAQQAMQETAIVRAHPHWCEDGPARMLSTPGKGAHPRGMAIDLVPVCLSDGGEPVDMGTAFDALPADPARNPAHRAYPDLPEEVRANRRALERLIMDAAVAAGVPLRPLPVEWWDFRCPDDIYNARTPLSDADLLPCQRMTSRFETTPPGEHPKKMAEDVEKIVTDANDAHLSEKIL